MKDETIKINREMLREAIARAQNMYGNGARSSIFYDADAVERELFGPKKPREWTIYVSDGNPNVCHRCEMTRTLGSRTNVEEIRVREVLDDK